MKSIRTVTIADVAQAAQVSPATVARVVHGRGYVSAQKRAAIEQSIRQLGYVPNQMARGLRNQKTNLIGHVLPLSSENPFFARVSASIEEEAYRSGFHVLTVVSQGNAEKERAMVEDVCGLMVEALIFTAQTSCDTSLIQWVLSRGIPVVMIERPRDIADIDVVLLDSMEGARLAAAHFVSKGHRDIAYIGAHPSRHQVENSRFNGFINALAAHKVSVPARWVQFTRDYDAAYGYEAMQRILSKGSPPSGVFAASDLLACGVLQCLHDRKLSVPDDISLIGYDNTLASLSAPPLTSIELQPSLIGRAAVDMVLERTQDRRMGAKTVTLSPVLTERESVRSL